MNPMKHLTKLRWPLAVLLAALIALPALAQPPGRQPDGPAAQRMSKRRQRAKKLRDNIYGGFKRRG